MNTDVMAQSLLDSLSLIISTISSYVGLASFKINLDFKSTHECNLDFKKQFLHILKSALILKATLIVHR